MTAKRRPKWGGILAMAGVASIVVASCGGESAHDAGSGTVSGAGGSRAGSRSGMPGTSGGAGRGASAAEGGAGATTETRGGAGSGGSRSGSGGAKLGGGGSRAAGMGGSVVEHGAGAGTGGTLSRPRGVHACTHPTAWSANLELCDHGFVHRTNDAACPLPPHPEEGGAGGMLEHPQGLRVTCLGDTDCGANEYCVLEFTDPVTSPPEAWHRETETHCRGACTSNDDCASGEVCSCDPTFISVTTGKALTLGVCAPAGCHTDSDCPNGTLCVATLERDRLESSCETEVQLVDRFQCQSERDECSGADDCDWVGEGAGGLLGRLSCAYGDGHRSCYQYDVHPECEW